MCCTMDPILKAQAVVGIKINLNSVSKWGTKQSCKWPALCLGGDGTRYMGNNQVSVARGDVTAFFYH